MGYSQNIGDSRVIESRESADGVTIRRRRETPDGKRFTTYERIERPNLVVIKKDGKRELFDRSKLSAAIHRSVGKFFESEMEVESIISGIEDAVYDIGDTEVASTQVGDIVMDQLAQHNEVAYVRFASVYRDFKTLDDFAEILQQQREKAEKAKKET